jgi:hypothetical protein
MNCQKKDRERGMLVERFRLSVNQKRVLLANPDGFSNEGYGKKMSR